jgi:hypothetical protein
MNDLRDLREVASNAERIFETLLREKYPRADRFVWFRAREALRNGTADRFDRDMANDPQILRAHDAYIEALHAFYRARDGERGFLGARGL